MKKLKLTMLSKDELSKKQLSQTIGGSIAPGGCDGCLCNADVTGQHESNSSKAASKGGIA